MQDLVTQHPDRLSEKAKVSLAAVEGLEPDLRSLLE